MYVRQVQDRTLEFGHRGWLLDESFIFYDRQTDSLWVQATGTCIWGEFKGEQLRTLPVTHTTWAAWRTLHPTTVVLAKPVEKLSYYRSDSYADYYARHDTKFGLAVFVGDTQKLYPLDRLEDRPVMHDTVGDRPVLAVFHAPTGTAVAFDPVVAGKRLDFELAELSPHDIWLRDRDSGTVWSGLTGRPRPTSDARPTLRQLRTSQFTVTNWNRHFPNSPTFPP